ncbi:protein FAM122A-like isoform X2 [Actinia tenebrosa]|uniref:Protein FAM122A-like isoform X2 n=1 Tax=Actinia tenebrosa TaxID=6105 RepID=A0A6P8ILN4_ACTTE|nr:protein FAM122A-like isoform X2 [Actinia tenebrosa]
MATNEMETDDHTHLPVSSGLRRSNSAPNISVAVLNHNTPTFQSLSLPRQRRFSVNSPNQNMITVGSPASRVNQLKRDESVDDMRREVQREHEILSNLHLVHDLDESMNLDHDKQNQDTPMQERRNSFDGNADMFPSPAPSSPSPTRFQIPVRNARSLTPSPIPSPTRTVTVRRSLSPVCLRPSILSPTMSYLKRKCPSHGCDLGVSPSKRICDGPSQSTSPEGPCETSHLNFDEENYIHLDHSISHNTNTTSSTASSSIPSTPPMLFSDTQRIGFPSYRSRFTPPRSPLAGPAISHTHTDTPVSIATSQPCFTFAPVRE